MAPQEFPKATKSFVIPEMNKEVAIPRDTLTRLHKEYEDFSFEVDSIIDLSSDVSSGMPQNL